MQLLSFDRTAAEVFDELNQQRLRVGSMDLRIAAIAIANQMTLLTQIQLTLSEFPDCRLKIGFDSHEPVSSPSVTVRIELSR